MNERRNARAQECVRCGAMVPVGAGRLWYQSEAENEEMDRFDEPSGWLVEHLDQALCDKHLVAARQRRADQQTAQRDAAQALERASVEERAAFDAALASATVGLTSAGYFWGTAALRPERPVLIAQAVQQEQRLHAVTSMITGTPACIHAFGNATVLYADAETVRVALEAERARLGLTPEAARAWLASYAGCAGTELYAYAAGLGIPGEYDADALAASRTPLFPPKQPRI